MQIDFKYFLMLIVLVTGACNEVGRPQKEKSRPGIIHETSHQAINISDTSVLTHIPDGCKIIYQARGDINKDTIPDLILVIGNRDEAKLSDFENGNPAKRQFLILTGEITGSFRKALTSDKVVECIDCSGLLGDAFKSIYIEKDGSFIVRHEIMKEQYWEESRTFRYKPESKEWFLIRDHFISYRNDQEGDYTKDLKVGYEVDETPKEFGTISLRDFDIYGKNRR